MVSMRRKGLRFNGGEHRLVVTTITNEQLPFALPSGAKKGPFFHPRCIRNFDIERTQLAWISRRSVYQSTITKLLHEHMQGMFRSEKG